MTEHQESSKWDGEIIEEMKHVTPQQVWPLIADFCSLNKLFSHVNKCYLVEGVPGEPGLIRCCESSAFTGGAEHQYAKEKLVMIDQSKMSLTYQVLENNVGIKSYIATMQLFPIDNKQAESTIESLDGKVGCKFVWTIVADPIQGFTKQGFFGVLKSIAQAMAKRMEENFSKP